MEFRVSDINDAKASLGSIPTYIAKHVHAVVNKAAPSTALQSSETVPIAIAISKCKIGVILESAKPLKSPSAPGVLKFVFLSGGNRREKKRQA